MTLEILQGIYNYSSTLTLLVLAVWWSNKSQEDSAAKLILLIVGVIGFFNILLNI